MTDLTERKSLETLLRQSQKMEAVGRLAGGIAHDFNNVLTVIIGCAELVQQEQLTAAQRDDMQQIAASAQRAADLTRQLLTFSRQSVLQNQPLSVDDVVTAMGPMLQRLLRENIRVYVRLDGAARFVLADRSQLEQVILNIVVNASDAMPDGGTLTIETKPTRLLESDLQHRPEVRPGDFLRLSFTDTGIGMDAETMEKIFDPFFTTKEIGKGTGLGLATVYSAVHQLGGFIEVRSAKGAGATFHVFLPVTQVTPATGNKAVRSPAGAVGQVTVLLVEDEAAVRRSLHRSLEQLGYTVLEASNGEVALGVVRNHHDAIDVVVTDMLMPGMNGKDFADYLHLTHPDVCVVFISGYIDETVRLRGLTDETHAFMQKPFNTEELGQTIQVLLSRRAAASASPSDQAPVATGSVK